MNNVENKEVVLSTLYRKNNQGQVCIWKFTRDGERNFYTYFKVAGGTERKTAIICTHKSIDTFIKRTIADKRKAGYKALEDVKDNQELPASESSIIKYLEAYLPDDRSNANGDKLHMLATTYKQGDVGKRDYFVQPKINGLRCGVFPYRTDDIFSPIRLRFQSREGGEFTSLTHLEAELIDSIGHSFLDMLIDRGAGLDGELYIHGKPLNAINSAVKNSNNPDNKLVEFWCYDMIDMELTQSQRKEELDSAFYPQFYYERPPAGRFKYLSFAMCYTDDTALINRNRCIADGFEGLILRDTEALYQFGKRNKSMLKYKQATDGIFVILDIYPQSAKRPDLPMLLLGNDINHETFEAKLSYPEEVQRQVLIHKDDYIATRRVYLTYGERSGVKQVPFHIKTCVIR